MYRNKIEELKKWKNSKNRLPLVLRGARQVGKTWLLQEFGKKYFDSMVYLNLEDISNIAEVFEQDLNPARLIGVFENLASTKIIPGKTLIVLDEIQAVPRALTALKYFAEQAPEYHLAVAGSLLGIALHEGTSFPVGKVDFIDLYPMNYVEFLRAVGKEKLADFLEKLDSEAVELKMYHQEYLDEYNNYLIVGGMPAVVKQYVETKNFDVVRRVQRAIADAYELDFSKHAPSSVVPKIREIYHAIPTCLAKENKKFLFSAIKESARYREYEDALLWLEDTNLANRVERVKAAKIPLGAYAESGVFKLFLSDVGLLSEEMNINPEVITSGSEFYVEFKGALAEQFVFEEFRSSGINPFYYSDDSSRSEIDFIVEKGKVIIPIEVKSGNNLSSASFNNFIEKNNIKKAIKLSLLESSKNEIIQNYPIYYAGQVGRLEF